MATKPNPSNIPVVWVHHCGLRHARLYDNTLCGLSAPSAKASPTPTGLRCVTCIDLAKRYATPEGQLVYTALGRMPHSPHDVWMLAAHVVSINSKLATDLAQLTARIQPHLT